MKRTAVSFLTMLLMMAFAAALAEDPALDAARALIGDGPRLTERETEGGYAILEFREDAIGYEVICKGGEALALETEYQDVRPGNMTLTREEAEARLMEQRPGAAVSYAYEEEDDGRWLWRMFYTLGEDACMAELDPVKGAIRKETRLLGAADQVMPADAFVALLEQHQGDTRVLELNLELDEDAGLIIYEGEAQANEESAGKQRTRLFEFEADAVTGDLIQWKRD